MSANATRKANAISASTLLISLFLAAVGLDAAWAQERFITVGSTTEPVDSGLFNYILPIFRAQSGLTVHVVAVDTGQAFAMGERGEVDALLVNDPIGEAKFLGHGSGIDLRPVMYEDFVIVGPDSDPADIRHLKNAAKAFAQIARAGALFASRGDDSGTHREELRLWKLAGIEFSSADTWYRSLDQSAGATLNSAAAMNAYTLTDRATWTKFNNRQHLEILSEGDPALSDSYDSILENPAKWPHVKFSDARIWHEWLTSEAAALVIVMYRINGAQLFSPMQ
jgi:tungstate transport system substrate-binding protein